MNYKRQYYRLFFGGSIMWQEVTEYEGHTMTSSKLTPEAEKSLTLSPEGVRRFRALLHT